METSKEQYIFKKGDHVIIKRLPTDKEKENSDSCSWNGFTMDEDVGKTGVIDNVVPDRNLYRIKLDTRTYPSRYYPGFTLQKINKEKMQETLVEPKFKVGDKVKILRKSTPEESHDGYCAWVHPMDTTIGDVKVVRKVNNNGSSFLLEGHYSYSSAVLEKAPHFQVGDTVKVLRKSTKAEEDNCCSWYAASMDKSIGNIGVIEQVHTDGTSYQLRGDKVVQAWYSVVVLEKVETPNTGVDPVDLQVEDKCTVTRAIVEGDSVKIIEPKSGEDSTGWETVRENEGMIGTAGTRHPTHPTWILVEVKDKFTWYYRDNWLQLLPSAQDLAKAALVPAKLGELQAGDFVEILRKPEEKEIFHSIQWNAAMAKSIGTRGKVVESYYKGNKNEYHKVEFIDDKGKKSHLLYPFCILAKVDSLEINPHTVDVDFDPQKLSSAPVSKSTGFNVGDFVTVQRVPTKDELGDVSWGADKVKHVGQSGEIVSKPKTNTSVIEFADGNKLAYPDAVLKKASKWRTKRLKAERL